MHDAAERSYAQFPGLDSRGCRSLAHCLQAELFLWSQPHQHHPPGRDGAPGVIDRDFTLLAAKIAVGNGLADGPADGLVNRAGGTARLVQAFKEVDDNQLVFPGLYRSSNYLDLHDAFSSLLYRGSNVRSRYHLNNLGCRENC